MKTVERFAVSISPGGMFALKVQASCEWANWSDGISQKGAEDEWARRHAFQLKHIRLPPEGAGVAISDHSQDV